MNEEELKETIGLLGQAGVQVMLCDTQVPRSSIAVKCGQPAMPGDSDAEDYILLPKSLVGSHPEIFVPAVGDSMTGVNFEEGDLLRVQLGVTCNDGDNVLAWIDGSCTVKTYFQDDEGLTWLVPQNESYDAILITGEYDVKILGRVVGVEKRSPRVAFRDCQNYVKRAKTKMKLARLLSPEQVDNVIRNIGPEVRHARQWYAVYRALADHEQAAEGSVADFCSRVAQVVPTHGHLPTPRELQRMAVQSFSKPVALWSAANAPVSGVRFMDYLRIAKRTASLLTAEQTKLPF
ncbi:MAG: hypothetical protein IJ253_08080 [Bacteroidaceae bacterium]|nr:hypothetical protein [Bacteroidaceae bacterium]